MGWQRWLQLLEHEAACSHPCRQGGREVDVAIHLLGDRRRTVPSLERQTQRELGTFALKLVQCLFRVSRHALE